MMKTFTIIIICLAIAGVKHFNNTTVAMTQYNHQIEVAMASLGEEK